MLKFINGTLVVALVVSAFVLYSREHASRKAERELVGLKKQLLAERDHIKLLKAEWSHHTRPQNLERLARKHLNLKPVRPEQLLGARDIDRAMPERKAEPEPAGLSDPIGNLVEASQQ